MSTTATRCRFPRRIAIIVYDALVVAAILFFATTPVVLLRGGAMEGESWFTLYLLLVSFAFYGGFWTHGGQTIGMRAWRVRVQRRDGEPLSWRDAALRFLAAIVSWAPLGAGLWWALVDRESLAWHDRMSRTELVRA